MNTFLIVAIAAVIIIYILLKLSHLRTQFAFFFILIGVLFMLFVVFLFVSGSNFSFSSIDNVFSSFKGYFLWVKGLVTNVFQFTGKIVGTGVNNSTG